MLVASSLLLLIIVGSCVCPSFLEREADHKVLFNNFCSTLYGLVFVSCGRSPADRGRSFSLVLFDAVSESEVVFANGFTCR